MPTTYNNSYIFDLPRQLGEYKFFILVSKTIKNRPSNTDNTSPCTAIIGIEDWFFDDDAKTAYDIRLYLWMSTVVTIPHNNTSTNGYKWVRTNRTIPMYAQSTYGANCGVRFFGIY